MRSPIKRFRLSSSLLVCAADANNASRQILVFALKQPDLGAQLDVFASRQAGVSAGATQRRNLSLKRVLGLIAYQRKPLQLLSQGGQRSFGDSSTFADTLQRVVKLIELPCVSVNQKLKLDGTL